MKLKTLKNKYALTYPLLALSLVLGSCSQEEGDNTFPEDSQRKTITFTVNPVTAETKDISTRVSLNTGSSNGNDGLDWVNNDKVSFYFIGENYNNVKKTFTVSVGGTTTITGETPETEGDYTIFAISPYKSTYFPTYGSTTLTIPASLTQDPDPANLTHNHLSDYIYMYANPSNIISVDGAKNATGGDIALDFNLLISLLRFEIVNNSSSDIKLQSVSISYPDEAAKLYSTLELDENNYTFSPTNASHEKMTLNFSDIALASGNGSGGYLPIFPTTIASALNVDVNITRTNNKKHTIPFVINDIQALEAGSRYIIPLTIIDTDIPAPSFDDDFLEYDGYLYTPNDYVQSGVTDIKWHNGAAYRSQTTFTYYSNPCPDNYELLIYEHLPELPGHRQELLSAINYPQGGFYDDVYSNSGPDWMIPYVNWDNYRYSIGILVVSGEISASGFSQTQYVPVKCRRPI